jgi:glucose/arabinose dehydrogenase
VRVRIDHPDAYTNHNGGQLAFGPGGRLLIGVGDGGSGCDPWRHAQRLSSRMGKILSLDVDRPDAGAKVRYYGLRNPWRFSFDRVTHDIWIGDVGQDLREEIDFVRARHAGRLRNFGWDVYEGRLKDTCPHGRLNRAGALRFPVRTYSHADGRCSITGGFVYRGTNVPGAVGRYFFGDYCKGRVWSLRRRSDGTLTRTRAEFAVPHISSFGEDSAGELYMASLDGKIYKLRP